MNFIALITNRLSMSLGHYIFQRPSDYLMSKRHTYSFKLITTRKTLLSNHKFSYDVRIETFMATE